MKTELNDTMAYITLHGKRYEIDPKHIDVDFNGNVRIHGTVIKVSKDVDTKISQVVFDYPITMVFWKDGTTTYVKCGKNEHWDPEKGLAMAISKKYLGNATEYYNVFKKFLGEYYGEN